MKYYAHSAEALDDWEPLADHLRQVAELAAEFATEFACADEARFAGLLHDLGKFSETFLARLQGRARGLDHWSAGAFAAAELAGPEGGAAALAIYGHHVGLHPFDKSIQSGDFSTWNPAPSLRYTETDVSALLSRLKDDGLELPTIAQGLFAPKTPKGAAMLDVRMLFSTLVDADFLATEEHFRCKGSARDRRRPERPRSQRLQAERALEQVASRLAQLESDALQEPETSNEVHALREDLGRACRDAARETPQVFTLTAPTGSGKTLALLEFALRHAQENGLRRIVLAVPYLSILDQTARIYRDLFDAALGPDYVLEHHSLAGLSRDGDSSDGDDRADIERRLLAENWDSPIILTTNVQLLESLFAHRPGPCRKLHRLAKSVILFDEVQTLPPPLAVPTLAALSRLSQRFGSTIVFATATQPAFDRLDANVQTLAPNGWRPRDIAPAALGLFDRVHRTRISWEHTTPRSFSDLAEEIHAAPVVLAIFNLKRHALAVSRELKARGTEAVFHLSTNLCPAHRERVLDDVRGRLAAGRPCRLVATQCVEAGVDLDFPLVLRAFGPLDSIAQAAGRCNRHGRRREPDCVRVFRPLLGEKEHEYPPGGYAQAADATNIVLGTLTEFPAHLDDPALFRRYYRQLYGAGAADLSRELGDAIKGLDFPTVAELYRLIEKDAVEVLVPYNVERYDALRQQLDDQGLTGRWIRAARPHSISIYRNALEGPLAAYLSPAQVKTHPKKGSSATPTHWWVLTNPSLYDPKLLGLLEGEKAWIA